MSVNYANSAGTAGFATNAGNANTLGGKTLAQIEELLKNSITTGVPNWNRTYFQDGLPYTAPSPGIIILEGWAADNPNALYINGNEISKSPKWNRDFSVPIFTGDTVTSSQNKDYKLWFVPYK